MGNSLLMLSRQESQLIRQFGSGKSDQTRIFCEHEVIEEETSQTSEAPEPVIAVINNV